MVYFSFSGWDDDGGGGGEEEGIEDALVAVSAASAPADPRVRRPSRKRKEADGNEADWIEETQPRGFKRTKAETGKDYHAAWTADEDAALLEGVDECGLDFGRIEVEAGAHLDRRTAKALYQRFREKHPDTFRELREANENKVIR